MACQSDPALEAYLVLLPPLYQHLAQWFFCRFWDMVSIPTLLVGLVLWATLLRQPTQNSRDSLCTALADPDHSLYQSFQEQIERAVQQYTHNNDFKERDTTNIEPLERRVQRLHQQLEGDISQSAYTGIQEAMDTTAKIAIEEAGLNVLSKLHVEKKKRSCKNRLAMIRYKNKLAKYERSAWPPIIKASRNASEAVKQAAKAVADVAIIEKKAQKYAESTESAAINASEAARKATGAAADVASLRADFSRKMSQLDQQESGLVQRIDSLESAISQQDRARTTTMTAQTIPTPTNMESDLLTKLQDRVDNHDAKLQSLAKIPDAVSGLQAEVTTTLPTMKAKLEEHQTLIGSNSTRINTLSTSFEGLNSRIDEVVKNTNSGESVHSISTLQTKVNTIKTLLAEWNSARSQVEDLNNRVEAVADEVGSQKQLLRMLERTPVDIAELADNLDKCQESIPEINRKVDQVTGIVDEIQSKVDEDSEYLDDLAGRVQDCEGCVQKLWDLCDMDTTSQAAASDPEDASSSVNPPRTEDRPAFSSIPDESAEEGPEASTSALPTRSESPHASSSPLNVVSPGSTSASESNANAFKGVAFDSSDPPDSPHSPYHNTPSASRPSSPAPISPANIDISGAISAPTPFETLPSHDDMSTFSPHSPTFSPRSPTFSPHSPTSTLHPPSLDDKRVDLDPLNPPAMDAESDEELLAGEERVDEDTDGLDVNAEGVKEDVEGVREDAEGDEEETF